MRKYSVFILESLGDIELDITAEKLFYLDGEFRFKSSLFKNKQAEDFIETILNMLEESLYLDEQLPEELEAWRYKVENFLYSIN